MDRLAVLVHPLREVFQLTIVFHPATPIFHQPFEPHADARGVL